MVKAAVDHRHDNLEGVSEMLKLWFPERHVTTFRTLRGGYSGTNYLVETDIGEQYVLKIAHGYNADDVEEQAKLGAYLKSKNFSGCCYPHPVAMHDECGSSHRYVAMIDESEPALLLNYIRGRAADYLIETGALDHKDSLTKIGYNLAMMHLLPVVSAAKLRKHKEDGICFLNKHMRGDYFRLFTQTEDEFIINHKFSKFYVEQFEWLINCFNKCECFRQSIVHGDPFLDNVLFDADTKEFLAFVDFEDACVGPSIVDLACCIVGNCFEGSHEHGTQVFNMELFHCLVNGYRLGIKSQQDSSIIDAVERELLDLKDVMKAALLLNASWRFQNFNIAFPEKRETHGMKYLELQERIVLVEKLSIN